MNSAVIFKFLSATVAVLTLSIGTSAAEVRAGLKAERLAAPSAKQGATMFVQLSPTDTGVVTENAYADPRMWGERFRQFEVGAIGTGVAVGDYDEDGRPDIFVVSKTESCRLFRNLGGWKFADVTDAAGVGDKGMSAGEWKQGAAFVDINNDGRLDLYVCRFDAPNLLYLNQGDGTFVEKAAAYGLDVKDACSMAAFCDYDRDGWLDVFIQTNFRDVQHPNGQRDYLFHNNRNGTFTNVTATAGIEGEGYGHSATWWDCNGDGWPDLYVANDFAAPDKLYRNNRDGTFTDILDASVPHTPFSAMGADLGDVNNDGLIDFLVAEMAPTTHEKDQRTMAEVRSRSHESAEASSSAPQTYYNALYLNTGTKRFEEAAFAMGVAASDWTWSVRFEDLDNDGRLDLHITNGMFREIHNADLVQRMLSAVNPAERVRFSRASPVLAENNLAYRNRGDLGFENVSAAWGLDQKGVSFGAAFGDFDGDGDLDLVFTNYQGGATLLRNDCDRGHRLEVRLEGTRSNRYGVGAKVRIETKTGKQVRELVLARGYLSTSEPMVHFGLGPDEFVDRLSVDWPSGAKQTFEGIEADRVLTITEPSEPGPPPTTPTEIPSRQFAEVGSASGLALASHESEIDEFSAQPLLPMRHNRIGPALAVGDVDGDGSDDVVFGGTSVDPLRVLIRQGDHFSVRPEPALPTGGSVNDGPVLLFDADGDGRNDLLVTKGGARLVADPGEYQPRLFLGDGSAFRPAGDDALPSLPLSVGAAVAVDFNRDGRLDLFLGGRVQPGDYPSAPLSALLVNRGGKFEDVTDALAPGLRRIGMVTAALWSDVDGDGWPDLVVALEWGGVKYFHNREGNGFDDLSKETGFEQAGTGWWNSLAAADFNGDGRIDYVVGNVGLNTPYRATPTHPAVLYYGQFAEGSPPEIVEGYYEGDRLVPRRVRRQMGLRIPAVLKRFPGNDRYARATLPEIVGEDRLSAADKWTATELRSGVFLSQADGTFRFAALPAEAQLAPLQGMVTGDFDGDGHTDVYAVQNSYAPAPSMGRFDGGLSVLLRGDGEGHFKPAALHDTGLVVPGDAKALVTIDVDRDGSADFLVTRNQGTSLAFRHERKSTGRAFSVELRGRAGNPTAVGSRIAVQLKDGSTQSCEVYAGSGYLSQSTSAQFFGYAETNPPRHVTVRWPSGVETRHELTETTSVITLTEPPAR